MNTFFISLWNMFYEKFWFGKLEILNFFTYCFEKKNKKLMRLKIYEIQTHLISKSCYAIIILLYIDLYIFILYCILFLYFETGKTTFHCIYNIELERIY